MLNLLFVLSPVLSVAVGALLLMLSEAFGGKSTASNGARPGSGRVSELGVGASVVLLVGAVFSVAVWMVLPSNLEVASQLAPHFLVDRYSLFFGFVLCVAGAIAALLAGGYLEEHGIDRGEFFPILLWATVGAMALVAAGDLITLFVALETMSIGAYAMIGLRRGSARAAEAALKYYLLGSFAAGILLFGMVLLYGATGHTDLVGIGQAIQAIGQPGSKVSPVLISMAVVLVLVGLGFKVSAVPFHQWTPDAYEGAPTPATTFMAASVKTAAFGVFLRVLLTCFGDERLASWGSGWPPILAGMAVLTMVVANVIALRQDSVKRMLAYSSISHAGYLLIGTVAALRAPEAQSAVMFYLLTYSVSTAGAFGALILCGRNGAEAVSYADLAGLGRRNPGVAAAFSVFLLSLAGIPPMAGFLGKLYIFRAAIESGLYWLAVIGLLNSVVAAFYYLRVLEFMYMREPVAGAPIAKPMRSSSVVAGLVIAGLLVVWLGLFGGFPLAMALEAQLPR